MEMVDICIDKLSDFVEAITDNKSEHFYHDIAHMQTVYRGQANKDRKLLPAAFRNNEDFLNESIYLRECLREIPEELDGLNYFDILVKAQHYGIPTRLLDFSLNPLVALYFACIDEVEKDGCVFVFNQAGGFSPQDYSVQIIMHYLFKYKHDNSWDRRFSDMLSKSLERHETKYFLSSTDSVDKILQKPPDILFIIPNLNNARIRTQQGIFALFNTRLSYKKYDNGAEYGYFCIPQEEDFDKFTPNQIIIVPKEKKAQILIELAQFGIHQAYLFPEFELHVKYIVEKIRNANEDLNSRIITARSEKI